MQPRLLRTSGETSAARRATALRLRHRQRHRFHMAMVDLAIARLERLNLADMGATRPDEQTVTKIGLAMDAIPDDLRGHFSGSETVKEALNRMFEVQAALLERRHAEVDHETEDEALPAGR